MRITRSAPFLGSTGNLAATASSGGGANATVTISSPASTALRAYLSEVVWSYSTDPTGTAQCLIYDGTSSGVLMHQVDIAAGGPDGWVFGPLGATPGNPITVRLTQAGSSIVGRLNAYAPLGLN